MRGSVVALAAALLLVVTACQRGAEEPTPTALTGATTTAPTTTTTTTEAPEATEAVRSTVPEDRATAANAIEAVQIDGVWVFQHEPGGGMEALHSGTPEIVDGCLVIGDMIVVWHIDRMEEAAAAVAAAKGGESTQLLIGGGGFGIDQPADPSQIPPVIADRCTTRAVWFGAP